MYDKNLFDFSILFHVCFTCKGADKVDLVVLLVFMLLPIYFAWRGDGTNGPSNVAPLAGMLLALDRWPMAT